MSSPAVAGGTVYVGSWDDKVYALDAATGHLHWSYEAGDAVNSPVVAGGIVHVGSFHSTVYALDARGLAAWPAAMAGLNVMSSARSTLAALVGRFGIARRSTARQSLNDAKAAALRPGLRPGGA